MTRRRSALIVIGLLLIVADSLYLVRFRYRSGEAVGTIRYVGLDSMILLTPASQPAASLRGGRWEIDGRAVADLPRYDTAGLGPGDQQVPVVLVTLAPQPTLGHLVEMVRDLKGRKICHVLIREAGEPIESLMPFPDGSRQTLQIPVLVLCGRPMGDGATFDTLPPDEPFEMATR